MNYRNLSLDDDVRLCHRIYYYHCECVYSITCRQVVGGDSGLGEMLWGRAIGISMAMGAISAPILGAVADFSRAKKRLLFMNLYLTAIFTALLYFIKAGDVFLGMLFFIIANYGFNSANVFYDSFLPDIAKPEDIGKVSGYGWALGYVGGLLACSISGFDKINVRLSPAIALHLCLSSFIFC